MDLVTLLSCDLRFYWLSFMPPMMRAMGCHSDFMGLVGFKKSELVAVCVCWHIEGVVLLSGPEVFVELSGDALIRHKIENSVKFSWCYWCTLCWPFLH